MSNEHLVVNLVMIDNQEITVGATNSTRWMWDTDDGQSGADARTIVWVTLKSGEGGTNSENSEAVSEMAGLFCSPGDPHRSLAVSGIAALFEMAWLIKAQQISIVAARSQYFGHVIKV